MQKKIRSALEVERQTVQAMIALFCRKQHQITGNGLCSECLSLSDYVNKRLDNCPFGEEKPTCQKCTVHCYKSDQRELIRQVMRWSGPRMLWHHPLLTLHHFNRGKKETPGFP